MKCRTCGQEYSSQWEQENLKNDVPYAKVIPKHSNKEFMQEVIDQIDNMEIVYFAGGEPLIMEQHYVMLEEMIRRGKTDIQLRYNTNFSNLKFKNKDLLALWQNFSKPIDVYASIDHVGERAEYIRHGTDWGKVEANLLMAKTLPYVNLQLNTVLSVFNYLTIGDFYGYVINKGIYTSDSRVSTLYNMTTPSAFTCHLLPTEFKERGTVSIRQAIDYMAASGFSPHHLDQLHVACGWATSKDLWEAEKDNFKAEILRVDAIRGEDFCKTFPELAPLMDL
jgi:organic radical activating enzyme